MIDWIRRMVRFYEGRMLKCVVMDLRGCVIIVYCWIFLIKYILMKRRLSICWYMFICVR